MLPLVPPHESLFLAIPLRIALVRHVFPPKSFLYFNNVRVSLSFFSHRDAAATVFRFAAREAQRARNRTQKLKSLSCGALRFRSSRRSNPDANEHDVYVTQHK